MRKSNKIKNTVKEHRKYHKVSAFTPDQQSFIKYLISRGYDLTLKVFQQEIQEKSKNQFDWFQKYQLQGKNVTYQQFKNWISQLRQKFQGKPNQFIKLQFLLLVWFCCSKSIKISPEKTKILKNFIQINGVKLSQFPQLLPYFALPYVHQLSSHPFLSTIHTKQWKQGLQQLFNLHFVHKKQKKTYNSLGNEQSQWFSIVKDLIQICTYFDKQSTKKTQKHLQLLQRVKKYKNVIQQNDSQLVENQQSVNPSQLSKLIYIPQKITQLNQNQLQKSIQSVSSVKQIKYEQISYQNLKRFLKKSNLNNQKEQKQICLIFYSLNQRIINCQTSKGRQLIINQYINNDILLLNQNQYRVNQTKKQIHNQLQCIKLISSMCASTRCVKYLSQNENYIELLCQIVKSSKNYCTDQTKNKVNKIKNIQQENRLKQLVSVSWQEQRLLQTLSILQKISFDKKAVQNCIRCNLVSIIVEYLINFQIYSNNVLTYILAIILNIILQKQGKLLCSQMRWKNNKKNLQKISSPKNINVNKQSLFERMIKIWKCIKNRTKNQIRQQNQQSQQQKQQIQIQFQLQSIIYSIFYVLLGVKQNKKIAKQINFKLMLEDFLIENNDQYHTKVVQHMMEVLYSQENAYSIDNQPNQQEENNDNDSFQEDFNFQNVNNGYIWVGKNLQFIQLQNQQLVLKKFYRSSLNNQQQLIENKNKNLLSNLSAPINSAFDNKQTLTKSEYLKQKKENVQIKSNLPNNSEVIQKVQGYDPNKYKAWKRFKTQNKN